MRTPTILLAALGSVLLSSCGTDGSADGSKSAGAAQAKVVATVNGVAITHGDLNQRAKRVMGAGGPDHDRSANVLQTVVRDELMYQKAIQLGLDREPGYRERVEELEAQLRAFRRQELSGLLRRYVQEHATATDAEAREYFEKNAAFIQTRFHVFQIFYKGSGTEIQKDDRDLKGGAPFELVASRRFPELPKDVRPPWDLGELRWFQIPPSWRGVIDRLEPGQTSDIVKGENDRFWVIKLADKRRDPGVAFEAEKQRILEVLHQQKADAAYDGTLAEMKAKANIVYVK